VKDSVKRTRAGRLREQWRDGKPALGAWAAIGSAFSAELMCVPGVDYICIDQQHGLIDYPQIIDMMRAIELYGITPFTRVPANESWMIGKVLDAGIQGVIVPMVSSGEEARKAVAACRYGKGNTRSYGPIRASMAMGSRDIGVVGDEVLCFVMVETKEGVEQIDEIASTPGLDGIYIGPADLALGLGLPPDLDKEEPEHVAAVEKILRACQAHNIIPGIQCGSGRAARKQVEKGFKLVTFFKDSAALPAAAERELAAAQTGDAAPAAARAYV
jgi:4-hydroxy-2-oxoheptanedioate aldolase